MARTAKDTRKRRLGYVLGSLDRAMEHTRVILAEFDDLLHLDPMKDNYYEELAALAEHDNHAQLASLLNMALGLTLQAQQAVKAFGLNAYGHVPDNL